MEQVGATIERTALNLQNLIQQKYEIMPQHRLTFTTLMQITLRRNQHFHKSHTEFTDFVMPSSGPSVTPPLPDQMFKTNLANSSKLSRHSQSCTTHKNELNKLFFILASRMIYIANIILGLSRSARESSAPPANLREFQLRLTEMKYLLIAVTAVCAMLTEPVFAQSTPKPTLSAPAQTARDNSYADTVGQWVPPYGEPVAQKTRAQVYRELVQAENDGQLAYLNSTIYAH
ncbi:MULTISPECIES: DUF4148 domain-containing protein [unclassified Burkholderia]|uniref:DUF4148 domain-containing protein n=1 Tax=unclassified Burkholderia TaxID=2613784 RepID=UPI000A58630F|nr:MULTISPECIES: DUF4148 domain-containing protein [unclassified Burkholderia]